MKNSKLRMPKVVETQDGLYINHCFIPLVVLNNGQSSTKVKNFRNYQEITVTFLAKSYSAKNTHKRKYDYKFRKSSKSKQIIKSLFSHLNYFQRESKHSKGSLFS